MIIVYGTRCYGRADVVEGVGHVTCRFVHIMFVPLIPIQTIFLTGEDCGVNLPFSFKAAASGWLRAGAMLTGLGMLAGAIASFADGEPLLGAVSLVVSIIAFAAFPLFGMLFAKCSPARRAELVASIGMSPDSAEGFGHAPMPSHPNGYAQANPNGAYPNAYPQAYPNAYPQPHAPGHAPPAGGFGQPPAYGASPQPGYGAPPAGGFGQPPAYGASPQLGYGAPPAGGFGQPPAYGAPPQPAFGGPPAPAYGAAPQPAFGGSPAPAYGAAPQPAFGAPTGFGPPQGYGPQGFDPSRR